MEAYLDNAATTRAAEEVVKIVSDVMRNDYGNPSSKHIKGVDAENYIKSHQRLSQKHLSAVKRKYFLHQAEQNLITWRLSELPWQTGDAEIMFWSHQWNIPQ